eukprot:CAMPEP_0196727276 /NCGR_PEP_ID=MMETSP1091-20130531/8293_1 /TAXON_ID=302021 /ORGANISM="Rhodomonas sp., Strain CCMP768" /LENGTH=277 /DNA_ID=CAMNT_0042069839 /DNA_START=24 /DNA_END=857 /DNA_ORIENTATION=-
MPLPLRYSVKDLFDLRWHSSVLESLTIDMCDDINPLLPMKEMKSPVEKDAVIRFRKEASPKEIKFVEDLDIPISQIVHAYNLSEGVTWPILKTFCDKTVKVPAFDIRMMRRRKPYEARIIFRSEEEVHQFLSAVPRNIALKGRVPKFEAETTAPRNAPKPSEDFVWTALEPAKNGKKSPISNKPAEMPVPVAQVSDLVEDTCSKAKETQEQGVTIVPTAVALDGGHNKGTTRYKSGGKSSNGAKSGTIQAISLDTLRRNSGVDLADDLFHLDTNIQV